MKDEQVPGGNSTPDLGPLIEAARRYPAEPAGARHRVMARVRSEARARRRHPPLTRLRKWLTAPRTVRLSPLGALAAAALVAALFAGPVEVRLRGATPSEVTAGTAVQFVLIDPDASSVWLVGDFNDWRRDATRLARTGPSGVWSVDVPLAPGRHAYAFIVDDVWAPDALAPKAPDSEFGQATSVVVVPGGHES